MRNRVLFLLLAFFIPNILFAEIVVKSFRKLESDLTARVDAPKIDQNGEACAIIKVVTDQKDFVWEPDGLGIMAADYKTGEYWLYVPHGAKRLTIKHPLLGVLREYFYPIPIEKATTYELVLITGRVETTVVEEISSQWLLLRPQPDNALIYIDDLFVKSGEYQAKLKPGIYDYRVEAPLYHSEAGKVEVSDAKKELNVILKPAFGYIDLSSSPESGATVVIDGKQQSKVTPFQSEPLASGEHTVQVVKDMFQPVAKKIMVLDGQTTPMSFTLTPNFAELSITAPADAMIFVNSQQKGTGTWKDRLNAGVYSLEARKDKHRPAKQDIEVVAGDKRVVDLQPTPIFGSLDVMTTPSGASIAINKKEYGTSPNTVDKLLIGDYTVQLSKPGYATVTKTVTVTEGKSTELSETLANGKLVSITSTPIGATLYIDGTSVGATPYSGSLTFGGHLIRIEKDGKKAEKTVTIAQSDGVASFMLSFGFTVTDMDGNVYKTVKFGTQVWMVENLKTTKYNDGTSIPLVSDKAAWGALSTPGYCFYNYDTANKNRFGALYNWYTVNTGKLAPSGWHVATDAEWKTLENYLIANGFNYDGTTKKNKIGKSLAATTYWNTDSGTGTIGNDLKKNNRSGFAGLPSGYRGGSGAFYDFGGRGYWWSSIQNGTDYAWYRDLSYADSSVSRDNYSKRCGFSVRCVQDY